MTAYAVLPFVGAASNGLTLDPTRSITFTENSNDGHIGQLIVFKSTYDVDRPWMMWKDENNRNVVGMGYHTKLTVALGGDVLKQMEIKTIASSGGPNPADMRTRFAIQCDVERGTWGVNYIDNFEINQAENPILTTPGSIVPAGLRIRLAPQDAATAGSATVVCASFLAQVDTLDNVTGFLDVNVPYLAGGTIPGNRTATLAIFRNTNSNSASSPQLAIKKGDGTNTNALLFTAKTGLLELPLAVSGTTGLKLGGDAVATLYRSAASTVKTDGTLIAALGVATFVKAGAPVDGDFTTPVNGIIVLDTTNNKIWARTGVATWKGVVIA